MSAWDTTAPVRTAPLVDRASDDAARAAVAARDFDDPALASAAAIAANVTARLEAFLTEFRIGNNYVYRDHLRQNLIINEYYLEVDRAHLASFDDTLAGFLTEKPSVVLPLFEDAVKNVSRRLKVAERIERTDAVMDADGEPGIISAYDVPDCQVMVLSNSNHTEIRHLDSSSITKLVRIHGIVIAAGSLSVKATHVHVRCKSCSHSMDIPVSSGFAGINLPRYCTNPDPETKDCPVDPFVVIHDRSRFVDMQTLKLQEAPDTVPVGELPRHVLLSCD
ncbi:minichromosome maintenance protein 5, partial [Cladochytrium tenue]